MSPKDIAVTSDLRERTKIMHLRPLSWILCVALLTATSLPLFGQLPSARLSAVFPPGIKAGETVDVVVQGVDLDSVTAVQFSHPGITATQKMAEPGPFDTGPQPVENTFVVKAAANVPQGCYEARVVGKYGLSNPRVFCVGSLAEFTETEPNNQFEEATEIAIPATVNGQSQAAADVDYYRFNAAANQRIIVDCRSRRIDSLMDAVVAVYDTQGRELCSSRDAVLGDPLLDFTAPAAGEYFVKVYDSVYQGSIDHYYRFSIGVLPHIDFVFPPAGQPGARAFTIYGRNLPGGQNAGLSIDRKPLQKLAVNITVPPAGQLQLTSYAGSRSASVDGLQYRLSTPQGLSNAVLVGSAEAAVVLETEPNNAESQSQKITIPCEVAGQFFPARDRDWFEFTAKAGDPFAIDLYSQRLGVASNPAVLVQQVIPPKEEGAEPTVKMIGLAEDSGDNQGGKDLSTASDDPQYQFTAPADGVYRVMAVDHRAALKSDPRLVYRMVIRKPAPDFRLVATAEHSFSAVMLRKGEQAAIRVAAVRRDGFDGAIQVTATGMPAGVTCTPATIGPGRNAAALILAAAPNAGAVTGSIKVTGVASINGANVTRPARLAAAMWPRPIAANNQPQIPTDARLAESLVVSVSAAEASPLTAFKAGAAPVYETSRGGVLKIPYTRAGGFKGKLLQVQVEDLPPNVTSARFDVNANAMNGEFEIKLTAAAPVGEYTLYLDGTAEKVKYSRNPEAAAEAAKRQAEVNAIQTKAAADAKAATAAKVITDKAAVDTTAAVTAATTAKAAADKALVDSNTALKTAQTAATAAKAASVAKPDDAALKTALAAADKAAVDAAAKVKTATDGVAAAQKTLDDVTAKAKVAADAKIKADELAASTTELAAAAAKLKAETDKRKTDLENAAKPKDVNVPVVSLPFVLKIEPSPITVGAIPPVVITQGEKGEATITFVRKYAYKGNVTLTAPTPSGVGGISIPNLTIPANQNQGKIAITATAAATEGVHAYIVRITTNLNGQNVVIEEPLQITIKKAPPKP